MSVSIYYTPEKSKTYIRPATIVSALELAFGEMPIKLWRCSNNTAILLGMSYGYGNTKNNPYTELYNAIETYGTITINKEC